MRGVCSVGEYVVVARESSQQIYYEQIGNDLCEVDALAGRV